MTLPLRFALFGLACLALGVGILVARPELLTGYHYNQHIIATTHLFLPGFVMSIIMGALYQLAPVAMETELHSERLAKWHFVVHVISVAGMVWMFWIWDMKQVGHFGSGLALGVGMFAWNIGRTLLKARRWTPVSFGLGAALFWLVCAVGVGLALSAAKCSYEAAARPETSLWLALPLRGLQATAEFLTRFEPLGVMHAHAHLGVLGCFILVTVSVAFKLAPMFLISEVQRPWRAWAATGLLNAGVLTAFFGALFQSAWKPAGACLAGAGLILYGWELRAIVRARRRRAIDWGLRGFLISQMLLAPVAVMGLALSRPGLALTEAVGKLENIYGLVAVVGVLALAILSMLFKILPFLVWFGVYGAEVGRARTPALHEMISARLQSCVCVLWLAGLAGSVVGIALGSDAWARAGALTLGLGLACFALNAAKVLRHWVRPVAGPRAGGPVLNSNQQPAYGTAN